MILSNQDIKAGKAIFTVDNGKGKHYTYKVSMADNKSTWFVSSLVGTDNNSSYAYLGIINKTNKFFLTPKSNFGPDSKTFNIFKWAFNIINGIKQLPSGYTINHAGNCLKCGRLLTTPESIESGYGPTCRAKT